MKYHIILKYIGDDFYWKSGTIMSSLYQFDDDQEPVRWDWGKLPAHLAMGSTFTIELANPTELEWANKMLATIKLKYGCGE